MPSALCLTEAPTGHDSREPRPGAAAGTIRAISQRIALWIGLAVGAAGADAQSPGHLPPPAPRDPEITRLIKLLGHNCYVTREKAGGDLAKHIDIGNSWQLREAFDDRDPEIVRRVRKIAESFHARPGVKATLDAQLDTYVETLRPKGWPVWPWVETALPEDFPGREWQASYYVQAGRDGDCREGLCKQWPASSKGMKLWTKDTLQDPERWRALVQYMKEKKLLRGGETGDAVMQTFLETFAVAGSRDWVRAYHRTFGHKLDEDTLRSAGVLPPKEAAPKSEK